MQKAMKFFSRYIKARNKDAENHTSFMVRNTNIMKKFLPTIHHQIYYLDIAEGLVESNKMFLN